MKMAIMTATVLALATPAWALDNGANGSVELRITHDSPGRARDRMELLHQDTTRDSIKEMLFVDEGTPLVDQSGIRSARVINGGDGVAQVELSLANSARDLRRDSGKRVAVVVDGQAVGVGTISAAGDGDRIDLSGDFTPGQAQRLADEINHARP